MRAKIIVRTIDIIRTNESLNIQKRTSEQQFPCDRY